MAFFKKVFKKWFHYIHVVVIGGLRYSVDLKKISVNFFFFFFVLGIEAGILFLYELDK